MQVQRGVGFHAGLEQRVPVAGVDARKAQFFRLVEEREHVAPAGSIAANLVGGQLCVAEPGDGEWHHPVGIRTGPVLDRPVVPGLHRSEPKIMVLGLHEARTAEAGHHRRETHRGVHAGEIHVRDAVVDIPTTATHVLEPRRIHRVLRRRAARDGVGTGDRDEPVLQLPVLGAIGVLDNARCALGEAGRHPALERLGGLDEVVVHGDHGVMPRPRFRLGQERHLGLVASGANRESLKCLAHCFSLSRS